MQATTLILATAVSACSMLAGKTVPPTLEEIRGARISGLFDNPVTLSDGRWEGEPYVAGGASRPTAGVAGDFSLTGDLTGDGNEETVAFLWSATGGSGTRNYIGVFKRDGSRATNVATALIGDRVQVRGGKITEGRIELEVVQHGPDDARCCPATKATRVWVLDDSRLEELPAEIRGRIGVVDLESTEWRLVQFGDQQVRGGSVVTFEVENGRVGGQAACNRYMGSITDGETPGMIEVSQLASTQMACADEEVMRREREFLATLGAADRFGFLTGQLILSAIIDGELRTLRFAPVSGEAYRGKE